MAIYHPCNKCEISFDFCRCETAPLKRNPIKQSNSYSCGPVAIRNACWALGIKLASVTKIVEASGTGSDGTSIAGLRRGARLAGLNLERVFISSAEDMYLVTHSDTPLILGYTVAGEGHYCVILRKYQLTPGMGAKYEYVALNWEQDTVVAFNSHSGLLAECPVTEEWLIGKLLAPGTDVYLTSKRDGK